MTGLEGVGWILILGTLPWIVFGGVTAVSSPGDGTRRGRLVLSKPLPPRRCAPAE